MEKEVEHSTKLWLKPKAAAQLSTASQAENPPNQPLKNTSPCSLQLPHQLSLLQNYLRRPILRDLEGRENKFHGFPRNQTKTNPKLGCNSVLPENDEDNRYISTNHGPEDATWPFTTF